MTETHRAAPARVLVVDDDADLCATLKEWLELDGYEVWAAGDGAEALDLARWESFDVVVTDLKMPRLNGLELLTALKAIAPEVRVIFLSGEATKADTIAALREGRSFDFLEKPLHSFEHLSRVIRRALAAAPSPPAEQVPAPAGPPSVIEQVFAYMHAHLHEPISLAEVADALGYSPSYLTGLVRQQTGQPVLQWITTLRLERACRMLRESDRTIVAVAEAVGIQDAKYFSRLFKKAYGLTPNAWREAQG